MKTKATISLTSIQYAMILGSLGFMLFMNVMYCSHISEFLQNHKTAITPVDWTFLLFPLIYIFVVFALVSIALGFESNLETSGNADFENSLILSLSLANLLNGLWIWAFLVDATMSAALILLVMSLSLTQLLISVEGNLSSTWILQATASLYWCWVLVLTAIHIAIWLNFPALLAWITFAGVVAVMGWLSFLYGVNFWIPIVVTVWTIFGIVSNQNNASM